MKQLFLSAIFFSAAAAATPLPDKVGFNEHVRTILSNNCFYCHGPDEKHREAKLRLDIREEAVRDLGGYAAIVPGKPDASELMTRVTTHDEDDIMPPLKSKKHLTPQEIEVFRKWIAQGAKYEGHWAFLPLAKSDPPAIADCGLRIADWKKREPARVAEISNYELTISNWPRNSIDAFVLKRMLQEGVVPSPEADRATLIRRVHLDLTGLLPAPEEVDGFVKDPAPDAYERLVEKLLASPHYGERWGRHWLDQARYADSNGYSIDGERAMWPYRDWVIAALNSDMPFDRFTIEQIAGDLLPNPTKSQLVATAFHRNTLINQEGGTDPEQFRVEAAIDRVNTTSAVWLGLTVGCAQCHTHKFDPITQREFYQMYAFFNSGEDRNNKGATIPVARGEMFGKAVVPPGQRPLPDAEVQQREAAWEKAELARLDIAVPATRGPVRWMPAEYVEYDTTSNAGFRLLPDNSLLSDGRGSANDTYRVVAKTALKQIAAVRLRTLTDDSLPGKGPGTAGNGNFVLTEFEAFLGEKEQAFARAFADHEQPKFPASAAIDGDSKTGWAINIAKGSKTKMNAEHNAVFVFAQPVNADGQPVEFRLHHELNPKYLIGRFALEFSENAPEVPEKKDAPLLAVLRIAPEKRSAEQMKLVEAAFERAEPKARKKSRSDDLDADVAEVMVMKDLAEPRQTFLFQRGDFLRPDTALGPMKPGFIQAVSTTMPEKIRNPKSEIRNRLDLARWLVSAENPLTPRVTMNRIWMRYFGRGLVETEEDFGTQGTPPSHPELLDWLGREFIRCGWSMKAMHRLIVNSATYRQSSKARPDLAECDPRNLLLARQERLRVDAELIRDAALSASGLLDATIGGPGFRPQQPEGVYSFTQNGKKWTTTAGSAHFRRALYTIFYRSAPYPLFATFDAPNFQTTCTRRPRSDTPLQSLTLANDAVFMELAQGLALRMIRDVPGGDLDARLRRGFRLCMAREPSANEFAILRDYVKGQSVELAGDTAAAKALTHAELTKQTPPAEAAALVLAARLLLNTDNFITRE